MSEFRFPAVLTEVNGFSTVTAFNSQSVDPIFTADSYHPFWNEILEGLRAGDPTVWDKFDVAAGIMRTFQKITDRISWNGEDVLWDGEPVHDVLANQLKRAIKDGDSQTYLALAKFWEKLATNPNPHSREQAYNWLASHDFQITLDGDIVGYKGLSKSYEAVDGVTVYHSTASSRVSGKPSGYVNGKPIQELSSIPQAIGDVVSMPRNEVEHNPQKTCSRGLHVGDWSHAKSYGNTVVEVIFNPRAIVSVPTDAGGRKVRVHEYTLSREIESVNFAPDKKVLHSSDEVRESWQGDVGYDPSDF